MSGDEQGHASEAHEVDLSLVDTYALAAELIKRGFLNVEMTLDEVTQ